MDEEILDEAELRGNQIQDDMRDEGDECDADQ